MVKLAPKEPVFAAFFSFAFSASAPVFHQQPKDVPIKLIRDSKLPRGMSV